MGTLGKALGASGGYICGSRALIDYLINRARTFIFSTAPVPAAAAAATAGVRFVQSGAGEERRKVLWQRVADLSSALSPQPSTSPERDHPHSCWAQEAKRLKLCGAARAGHFHPRRPLPDGCARPGAAAPDSHRRAHSRRSRAIACRAEVPGHRTLAFDFGFIMHRLAELDHRYLWHPFTQMRDWLKHEPIVIVEGKGALLWDAQGREYLDANSSIWTNLHGHNHPRINAAIHRQLRKIAHSSALGLANEPASLLAEKLVEAANPQARSAYAAQGLLLRRRLHRNGSGAQARLRFARRTGRSRKPKFLTPGRGLSRGHGGRGRPGPY